MSIFVTGAAGFIGFHVSQALLARGERVIGIDNVNDYYDPTLKENRAARLLAHEGFSLVRADIADKDAVFGAFKRHGDIERIIHLAAQAGVRYSLINPHAYTHSNVEGHLMLMEAARTLKNFKHFVYASSSSVYGANTKLPFSIDDPVDHPVSMYAATKRAMELLSESYARMYKLPLTGLRFFTVYGPWGRPDMAAYIFTRKIVAGESIPVFNGGDMRRDFTYIDDIVAGVLGVLETTPEAADGTPHRLYNLGNNNSEQLMRFIGILETALQRKAEIDFQPMQTGDVQETFADIAASTRDFGFVPKTPIDEGIPRFVGWYKDYHGV
ncbi:MAG: NAD-dependent epimerase/dehydratase family protein [Rhodospirillaceae bacterium]